MSHVNICSRVTVYRSDNSESTQSPMLDILALLQCLQPYLADTTLHQFDRIVLGLLGMTGRVTMLGIARWAGPGGT